MKKIEMVTKIKESVDSTVKELRCLGYRLSTIEKFLKAVEELSYDELIDIQHWFKHFEKIRLQVREVRRLLPDEIWDRYTLFEVKDLREQRMLRSIHKQLREIWKNRPPIRSTKDDDAEENNSK